MKKFLFILLLSTLVLACTRAQQNSTLPSNSGQSAAELSFSFTRLSGSASNQFAVWVEDAQGKFIKTLYATKYTANGGWKRRETSIPVWVGKSGLSGLTPAQIDAVTGATPRTGTLTYTWDGTDSRGAQVLAGNYFLFLEGTLRWENQVLYRAPIRLGSGAAAAEVSVEYKGDAGSDRSMIGDVKARSLR
jgi:hypothetical protein